MKLSSLLCWLLIVVLTVHASPQSQQAQTADTEGQQKKLLATEHSGQIKSQVQAARGTGEKAKVKVTLRDKSL